MRFGEFGRIRIEKVDALKKRAESLGVDVRLVEEVFVRGGGKGGQKINKTANAVQLFYPPLELRVRCQKERERSANRFFALRELIDEIEIRLSPETSRVLKEQRKIRKQKDRRKRRSKPL